MTWLQGDRTIWHLQTARTLRSIGQGIAVVDLALYLRDLHWTATAIGGVLTVAGLVGAVFILGVGILSDQWGRKPFLMTYEVLTVLSAVILVLTQNPLLLSAVIVVTGFGRGQNGAAGPFTPAEQAWMAGRLLPKDRGRVFSVNTALGFFGMGLGAVLAGVKGAFTRAVGAASYHPLFIIILVASLMTVVVIATAPRDTRSPAPSPAASTDASIPAEGPSPPVSEGHIRREENRNMTRLFLVNTVQGLAIGFMGPMMSYWFAARFGVSASAIGVTFALSFLVTGVSSLVAGGLADRMGMVRSVVWLQLVGVLLILLMPFVPTFWMASVLYVLRSAFSRGTQGSRSALSTSLTRDERRGFSVSLNALAFRLSSSVGPTLAGYLLESGDFAAPLVLAGVLQLGSTLLYGRLFKQFDQDAGPAAGGRSAAAGS